MAEWWSAVGGHVDQGLARWQQPRHRVHGGDFEGLRPAEPGQDGGQPFGEHGLAGAGRAFQEQVVATGRGYLHRRARRLLADDVGEVVPVVVLCRSHAVHSGGRAGSGHAQTGHERVGAALEVLFLLRHGFVGEDGDQLAQAAHSEHRHAGDEGRLGRGAFRHDHLFVAGLGCGQDRRQDAAHRPHPAVEPQLSDHHDVGQDPRVDPLRRAQDARGDGEVEAAAALGHRGRAETDRQLLLGPLSTRVHHGRPHPVPALREALVRQSHQREGGHARLQVGLDLDHHALDADERHRARTCEPHHATPWRARPPGRRAAGGARRPGRSGHRRAGLLRGSGSSARRAAAAAPPCPGSRRPSGARRRRPGAS